MYTRKKFVIIVSILSFLLICSISILIVLLIESNQKSYDLLLQSKDYQNQIDKLEDQVSEYAEQYYLIKNQLDQKNNVYNTFQSSLINQNSDIFYRTLYELDLKTEMTQGCAIIMTIPEGAKVSVENSFFGDFWQVTYKGKTGWVDANGTLEKI